MSVAELNIICLRQDIRVMDEGADSSILGLSSPKGSARKEPPLTVRALFGKSKYGEHGEVQDEEHKPDRPKAKRSKTRKGVKAAGPVLAKKSKPPQSGEMKDGGSTGWTGQ